MWLKLVSYKITVESRTARTSYLQAEYKDLNVLVAIRHAGQRAVRMLGWETGSRLISSPSLAPTDQADFGDCSPLSPVNS